MSTTGSLVRLLIFAVITVLLTMVLATTIGQITFAERTSYRALFSDASGVIPGNDIRVAGVRVGSVSSVEVIETGPDGQNAVAQVEFAVDSSVPVTTSTIAAVRYLNLVGQRYIGLLEGAGEGERLEKNEVIPLEQTRNALDLTVLFSGFQPLFAALEPEDVNTLSMQIIATLQGEGGTVESLLARTASLTTTLADRDALIGEVIVNLNETLGFLNDRSGQLSNTIVRLQQFLTGFAQDREAILTTLDEVNSLASSTEGFLQEVRPALDGTVEELRDFAAVTAEQEEFIDELLERLPSKLNTITRTATYGSFFNFYLCRFDAIVQTAAGPITIPTTSTDAPRCTPNEPPEEEAP